MLPAFYYTCFWVFVCGKWFVVLFFKVTCVIFLESGSRAPFQH